MANDDKGLSSEPPAESGDTGPQRRCWGLTRSGKRCRRRGTWRFFCPEHSRQPLLSWLPYVVFTILAGTASIFALYLALHERTSLTAGEIVDAIAAALGTQGGYGRL